MNKATSTAARRSSWFRLLAAGTLALVLHWTAGPASGVELFYDDFEFDHGNVWTFLQKGGAGTMNFAVQDVDYGGRGMTRALVDTSNAHSYNAPLLDGVLGFSGDPAWTDYSYSGKLLTTDDDGIGLLFRYTDDLNHYRLIWKQQDHAASSGPAGGLHLQKLVGGTVTELGSLAVSAYARAAPNTNGGPIWYDWQINLQADRIQVVMNDYLIFDVQDSSMSQGQIGVWGWGNGRIAFDDIVVESEVTFAPPVSHAPSVPFANYIQELFSTNFSSGDLSAWTVVDASTPIGTSSWGVVSGRLRDSTNVHSTTPGDFFGSLIWTGDTSWSNYLFQGRLQSDDDDALGFVFNYQDQDNFYRVQWSNDFSSDAFGDNNWDFNNPMLRLDLIKGGVFTAVADAPFGYPDSEVGDLFWTEFTVEARDGQIGVWLDGYKFFEIDNPELTNGAVGVFTQGCDESRFDDLSVFAAVPVLTWDNDGGGGDFSWEAAANWDPDQVPDDTTWPIVENGDTVLLSAAAQTALGVALRNGGLDIASGGGLTVTDLVQVDADGALSIASGGELTVTGALEVQAGGGLSVEGNLTVDSLSTAGTTSFAATSSLNTAALNVVGGSFDTNTNLAVDTMVISAGTVNTQGNAIEVGETLSYAGAVFSMAPGDPAMTVTASGMPSDAVVNFGDGTLTVTQAGAPAAPLV
ncbi:MAG: hypothetical protein ACYSWU_08315, partial [Planctomycetota bacterium]